MMKRIIQKITPFLPLRINLVEWIDPSLVLTGEKWTFFTISSWRIIKNNKLICGCQDDNLDDRLQNLIGLTITEIGIQANQIAIDPVFRLSDGSNMEIFSITYLEPWLFTPPLANEMMHVASPGDRKWIENLY